MTNQEIAVEIAQWANNGDAKNLEDIEYRKIGDFISVSYTSISTRVTIEYNFLSDYMLVYYSLNLIETPRYGIFNVRRVVELFRSMK